MKDPDDSVFSLIRGFEFLKKKQDFSKKSGLLPKILTHASPDFKQTTVYDSHTSILKSCKVAELSLKFDDENDDKNYEISIYETSTERRRHNHYI